MSISYRIENLCEELTSNKITERKKASGIFLQVVRTDEAIETFNQGESKYWDLLNTSVHKYLIKEAEKASEDKRKKGTCTQLNGSLFYEIVKLTITEGRNYNVETIIKCTIQCLDNDTLSEFCLAHYLNSLRSIMLPSEYIRSRMDVSEWNVLYRKIRSRYKSDSEKCGNYSQDLLSTFSQYIKFGPLQGFSIEILIDQHSFISQICSRIKIDSPRPILNAIMEIIFYFSLHTAKDSRSACCKLGEDTFHSIIALYEIQNPRNDGMKQMLVEYLLLQFVLHHPKGTLEIHSGAYAYSWEKWNECVKSIYEKCRDDIVHCTKFISHCGNTMPICTRKDIKYLHENFSRLFAQTIRQIEFNYRKEENLSLEEGTRSKRFKMESPLDDLISSIQTSHQWHWLNVMCTLIKVQPDIINASQFSSLLQVLSKLQVECKDTSLAHHIYNCLDILETIQHSLELDGNPEIQNIWSVIRDTTMRSFGLNQNDPSLHNLLQKLVIGAYNISSDQIFQTYESEVLDATEHNVKTLAVAYDRLSFPQTRVQKEAIIKWILGKNNTDDYHYLSRNITAKVLVGLLVNKWPFAMEENVNETKGDHEPFAEIADIYLKLEFGSSLIIYKKEEPLVEFKQRKVNLQDDTYSFLKNTIIALLKTFEVSDNRGKKLQHFLNAMILIKNILDYLLKLKLIDENSLDQEALLKIVVYLFQKINSILLICFEDKYFDDAIIFILKNSNIYLEEFFASSSSPHLDEEIRKKTPLDLLKTLYSFLIEQSRERKIEFREFKTPLLELRMTTIKLLVVFSCGLLQFVTENQEFIFDALVTFNYDINEYSECDLPFIFLESVRRSKVENLGSRRIEEILSLLYKLCTKRYRYYSCAKKILEFIYDFAATVAKSDSRGAKDSLMDMLFPFYVERKRYGPEYNMVLVDCIGRLYELDIHDDFAKWNNSEVILKLPEFLCDAYLEIRFAAIQNIIKFFEISSRRTNMRDYHLQEIIVQNIFEKSDQIFQVEGNLNEERKIDEIVSRSASALHMLSSVLITNHQWREDASFTLFKIVHKRRLDSFPKVLKMIVRYSNLKEESIFLEKYSRTIIRRWLKDDLDMDEFFFSLFACKSTSDFYLKYLVDIVPHLIENRKDLTVLDCTGKSLRYIFEECFSILCFRGLICYIKKFSVGELEDNIFINCLREHFGKHEFLTNFTAKLDEILLNLLSAIKDNENINQMFKLSLSLSKPSDQCITLKEFHGIIDIIQEKMCCGEPLVLYLLRNKVNKLQNLMMNLHIRIHYSLESDQKLIFFHQYTILNDLSLQYLEKSDAKEYFIREMNYVLIRIIKNNSEVPELRSSAILYFKKCLNQLVQFPEILRKYFIPTVTTFINIITDGKNDTLSKSSLDILNYLIIDHKDIFEENIKNMDNLPEHHLLLNLSEVQINLKKSGDEIFLKNEIQNIIKNGYMNKDCSSKVDTLKNLKVYLFTLKRQLKFLYKDLSKLNGFSEDCENSLLHQLVCLLVDLCHSKDKDVSMEALKCLGELGPSDLMTLIVKPEKQVSFEISTPQEFFTGQVLSLLNIYLIDDNIQIISPTMKVLFAALNTSEGTTAVESGNDYGYGKLPKEYFFPFFSKNKPKSFSTHLKKSMERLIPQIKLNYLWCPEQTIEYDDWIRNLLCNILETISDCYIPCLIPICKLKVDFCEVLLPSLIYLLVSLNDEINGIITEKINKFFEEHWKMVMTTSNKQNIIVLNKKAVKVMLSVVHFVRINRKNMQLKMKVDDLDLDYLKIAKAAQYCSAYFTSLLYTEIWCYGKFEAMDSHSYNKSILDSIFENNEENTSLAVLNIIRSSFKAIGDEDSLQGCGVSLLLSPHLRIEHFKDVGMWEQAILYQNMQLSSNTSSSKDMFVESLKHCGLYEASLMYNDQQLEPDYECMWRLSKWTQPEVKKSPDKELSFKTQMEKYKYLILKSMHERDIFSVMEHIENGRLSIVEKLKHTSLESSRNLYDILVYLQSFNEVEEFLNAVSNTDDLQLVIKKWYQQDEIEKKFIYLEPIITQRMIMLDDFLKGSDTLNVYKSHLIDFALNLSKKARSESINHFGIRALSCIRNLAELTENEKNRIALEDAQLCWDSNNKLIAKSILKNVAANEVIDPKLRSEALKLTGKWSAESYSDHPNTVIGDYLERSLALVKDSEKSVDDLKSIYNTYDIMSRFADRQYQQATAYIASDVFQKKVENLQKSQDIMKKSGKAITTDEMIAKSIREKHSKIDQVEIENTKKERENFLQIAIKYYMKYLACSDSSHLQIFRVMALFLENRSSTSIEGIEKYLEKIPTYKFLTIIPQLIPHIANENSADSFSRNANKIIVKCAKEHPHHTLPIILALANSLKDSEYSGDKTKITINEERVSQAKIIIKTLKSESSLKDIINKLESVSDALIEFAYLKPKDNKKKFDISKRSKIAVIKNFSTVSMLTHNLQIQKSGRYDNIIGIYSYETQYSLVGGKNAPKKINCIGTDGKSYEQLVKGQDDLRQDAVMQQVFTIMNNLLSANKHSHGLKIRTYKIVPLSMRSGLLEWAKNTMPVGVYLVGDRENPGAHQRYRPQDKRPSTCRQEIDYAAKTCAENRLRVFNKICRQFKPVFHKFFEENFLHPTAWYERRRAFIHSVATTSMVGYILGIGDRHVSNILIDKTTAELVHIDFGIAFEQGRILPTPETVPFRLTRDFVDAMGVCGVEGAFKKSCEKTMTVMKDNYQTIMAILEVLLYDPLYSWTVSVAEANKRQRASLDDTANFRSSPQISEKDSSVNMTAQRALMRLKAKLLGTEEGTPMSVEHQVAALVHQAMDPANLSKLFHGWQAYL